ncbi:MAG: cysteine desulfurase [Bacteroidetes bacterium]|nr:cysteine desulfurase [Bacteroidota bacterium]
MLSTEQISQIRKDFPILKEKIYNKNLVYLDNAATTQKPQCVIDEIINFYTHYNSNIHRGVHALSQKATNEYENARCRIQKFINAKHSEEIIFTRGATESINLLAATFGMQNIKENDEIIISHLEHHANIVPWQILCQKKNAKLIVIPVNNNGELLIDEFKKLITNKTKLISLVHVSNSLGTINPIKEIIQIAHSHNIPIIIDAAQSIQHTKIDVQALDCDFLVASGHKFYAPTGIGFLYGKKNLFDNMPPYQTGGDMILTVSFNKTIFNELPYKFEAGTPDIAGAIGLGRAIQYVQDIGFDNIIDYENHLLNYATEQLLQIDGLKIIGTAKHKASVLSFSLRDIHPHDIGTLLDNEGIAVRTGHHCSEPIMHRFDIDATTRASFAFYNTEEEIDRLVKALKNIINLFY